MFDDEFDLDFEETSEQGFKAERAAFERIGRANKLAEISEVIEGKTKTREQRFYENVDKTCRRIIDFGVLVIPGDNIEITESDIGELLDTAKTKLPGAMFKNAIAYVFGFITSRGGKKLKPDFINKIILGYDKEDPKQREFIKDLFKEGGIQPPDVVKYARLWQNL
jgi:hypothetical protein